MISSSNRWQSEIRIPADGSQPSHVANGTLITAHATPHTKGTWTDVIVAGDWSGFTGDAFEIEIVFTSAWVSGADRRQLADIGVDSGGGYSSIIDNLTCGYAYDYSLTGGGVRFKFPLRIANGVKVGCRTQALVGADTVRVAITLRGNPTHPGLVRAGTSVTTIGATTASSDGTPITSGGAAEGAWTEVIASTAADYWYWDFGWQCQDIVFTTGGPKHIDLAHGAASSEIQFATNLWMSKSTVEAWGKGSEGAICSVASGSRIAARIQSLVLETNESIIVYAVGGNYELPNAATATGTVQVGGVAVANGKTVEIFARDADGIIEFIGSTTTGGGTGAFSLGCPDITRNYWAKYEDGANVGCSLEGTPGTDVLDISIGSGGGGEAVDPVITTISTPVVSTDPLVVSVYDATSALALYTLTCKDRTDGKRLTIYNPIDGAGNAGFVHPFNGRSTVTGAGTSADPYIFTIYRRGRWPTGLDLDIRAQVVDAAGNEANA